MSKKKQPTSERQAAQHRLVEEARRLPGVAEVADTYARLSPYSNLLNVQPSQVRNATGGNG